MGAAGAAHAGLQSHSLARTMICASFWLALQDEGCALSEIPGGEEPRERLPSTESLPEVLFPCRTDGRGKTRPGSLCATRGRCFQDGQTRSLNVDGACRAAPGAVPGALGSGLWERNLRESRAVSPENWEPPPFAAPQKRWQPCRPTATPARLKLKISTRKAYYVEKKGKSLTGLPWNVLCFF